MHSRIGLGPPFLGGVALALFVVATAQATALDPRQRTASLAPFSVAQNIVPAGLVLTLGTNLSTFQEGGFHVLSVSVQSTRAVTVDFYLVVRVPAGQVFSLLASGGAVPGVTPFLANAPIAAGFVLPMRPVVWAELPALPAGQYTWFAAFTEAGTTNLVSNIADAAWTYADTADFTLFSNAGDPTVLSARLAGGETVDYFGPKDADGLMTRLDSVRVRTARNGTTVLFDEQGRPTEFISGTGARIRIAGSGDRLIFTAITPTGSAHVSIAVDLGALARHPPSAALAVLPGRRAQMVPSGDGREASPEDIGERCEAPVAAATGGASSVTVTQCDAPVRDAFVELQVHPVSSIAPVDVSQRRVRAHHVGNGVYRAEFVTVPAPPRDGNWVDRSCAATATGIGRTCAVVRRLIPFAASICAQLGREVDLILGPPSGEGVLIFGVCLAGMGYAEIGCSTVGFSPAVGAPNVAQRICDGVSQVQDAAAVSGRDDLAFRPFVDIPGVGLIVGEQRIAPASSPPSFVVRTHGDLTTSFSTNPTDPAPLQSYIATVEMRCATAATVVTLSIAGDDGYRGSTTCTIDRNGICSLSVPGAEAGVRDELTVSVSGRAVRQATLIF